MKNQEVIKLAVELMHAHNEACNYETFKDIKLNREDESIEFDIQTSMIGSASMITELLNLVLHIEPNTDPQSNKQLNFYIS